MMGEIIKKRERVHVIQYAHSFTWADAPGSGFSFDIEHDDPNEVPKFKLPDQELAAENYEMCLEYVKTGAIIDRGVVQYEHDYDEYAVLKCSCGAEVELWNIEGVNECDNCGRGYNSLGQEYNMHAYYCPICREGGDCGG